MSCGWSKAPHNATKHSSFFNRGERELFWTAGACSVSPVTLLREGTVSPAQFETVHHRENCFRVFCCNHQRELPKLGVMSRECWGVGSSSDTEKAQERTLGEFFLLFFVALRCHPSACLSVHGMTPQKISFFLPKMFFTSKFVSSLSLFMHLWMFYAILSAKKGGLKQGATQCYQAFSFSSFVLIKDTTTRGSYRSWANCWVSCRGWYASRSTTTSTGTDARCAAANPAS